MATEAGEAQVRESESLDNVIIDRGTKKASKTAVQAKKKPKVKHLVASKVVAVKQVKEKPAN